MISMVKFTLFYLSVAASVYSLTTPMVRSIHRRHAIAARAPVPVPEPEAVMQSWVAPRKRAPRQRCAAPKSSSTPVVAAPATPVVTPTSDAAAVPTPTSDPAAEATPSVTSSIDAPVATPDPTPVANAAAAVTSSSSTEAPPAQTPSSTTEAPPAQTPSSTAEAPPAQTPSAGGAGGGGEVHTGQITFYATGLGACGITNVDTDFIAAASHEFFDSFSNGDPNPNRNSICNRRINLTHNGKTINVAITDRCEACTGFDMDLSPSAFNALEDPGVGRTTATWTWA